MDSLGGLNGIAAALKVDTLQGLSGTDAHERRTMFGSNMRELAKVRSYCEILWDVLRDPLLRILFFAGIVSIIINESVDEDKTIGKVRVRLV